MTYPVILNGDHAEFELEHINTKPEERPDWPLPSFDARDWAKAFCKLNPSMDEGLMITWFANALMRGFDEHASRSHGQERERCAKVAEDVAARLAALCLEGGPESVAEEIARKIRGASD